MDLAPRGERIPSLDGIRGISAVLVVIAHSLGSPGLPADRWLILAGLRVAHIAVFMFFCLSGFLITGLVLSEREWTGGVNLRAFYARRAFRVLPVYFAYVIGVSVLVIVGVISAPWGTIVGAMTFTRNYVWGPALAYGILWSVCVEEQFYALWPPLVKRFSHRRLVMGCLLALIVCPVVRVGAYYSLYRWDVRMTPMTHLYGMLDVIAIGALIALTRADPVVQRWLRRLSSPQGLWILTAVLVTVILSPGVNGVADQAIMLVLMPSAASIWCGAVMYRFATKPDGALGQILNSRPVVALGLMSYSIYLSHYFFVNGGLQRSVVNAFPLNIVLAAILAVLVHRLIEKPLMRRGRRTRIPVPEPLVMGGDGRAERGKTFA